MFPLRARGARGGSRLARSLAPGAPGARHGTRRRMRACARRGAIYASLRTRARMRRARTAASGAAGASEAPHGAARPRPCRSAKTLCMYPAAPRLPHCRAMHVRTQALLLCFDRFHACMRACICARTHRAAPRGCTELPAACCLSCLETVMFCGISRGPRRATDGSLRVPCARMTRSPHRAPTL